MSENETTDLWIDMRMRVRPVRMDREGITFYSSHRFELKERYSFNVGGVFTVEGEVTSCEMKEMDSDFMEAQYIVESRFVGEGAQQEALGILSASFSLKID